MAGSCRDDGIDAIGSCLLGGLASLVTAGLLLSVVAAVVLWRLGVACGPLVPALGYFAGAALAWRLLWVFNDLQEVLGRSVVWVGVAAVPLLYPGLLLLVSRTGGRLVGLVEAAGVALLVAAFVGPGAVEGTEHRRFVASQREWLRSLPITIYEPVDLPAGYALASVEGRSSSPPQLKINLRAPERSLSLIESVPYPAFAPPGRCGLGFPTSSTTTRANGREPCRPASPSGTRSPAAPGSRPMRCSWGRRS